MRRDARHPVRVKCFGLFARTAFAGFRRGDRPTPHGSPAIWTDRLLHDLTARYYIVISITRYTILGFVWLWLYGIGHVAIIGNNETLSAKVRFRMSEEQIDWRETIDCLLDRSKRPFVPIDKTFVQMPRGSANREGPLATFVRNRDLRGLKAYLLIVASASSADENGEWHTTLPLQAWARAFGCFEHASGQSAKAAAGKIFARLEKRGLIKRTHDGGKRDVRVRLLAQDGSGGDYQRPTTGFLRLSHEFWKSKLDEQISLPALAMLLVILGERQPCELPSERMPGWYGWSADTAERGFRELASLGIIDRRSRPKKTPLSPTGFTTVNEYSVLPPYDRSSLEALRKRKRG